MSAPIIKLPCPTFGPISAKPRKETLYDTVSYSEPLAGKRLAVKQVAISLEVECCGETHVVEWDPRSKGIILRHHPEISDSNALKALLALGNEAPICIQLLAQKENLQVTRDGAVIIPLV